MKTMRFIIPLLFFTLLSASVFSQVNTPPPSTTPTALSQSTVMTIIKLAAYQLKMSPDKLWVEYQSGICCIHLVDEKTGTYRVEAGGGIVVFVESIF